MKRAISTIITLFIITIGLFAQDYDKAFETERAKAAIQDLKNGALIIRLPSNHKKIAALQETAKRNPSNARVKELIKITQQKTLKDAQLFAASLEKGYDFSNYYLMWDYSLDSLRNGIKSGYFLNNDLKRDETIKLKEDKFLTLRHGLSKNQSLESFLVTDQNLEDLEKPFPRYFRLNTFKYFFNSLFFAKTAKQQQMSILASEINERMTHFYARNL